MADTDNGPLSIADAVRTLSQDDRIAKPARDNRAPDDEEDRDQTPEEEDLAAGLAEEESDTPDEEGEGPPEDEEPEYGKGRFAADDAKVRLDDGKVITIAELRRGTLLQSDYSRKTQALAEERRAVEQHYAQVREVENSLAQQREIVAGLMQVVLPRPPDPAMLDPQSGQFDLVTYTKEKDAYERQSMLVQKMIGDHQAMLARQAYEDNFQRSAIRTQEAERLFERAPELRNPETYQRFWAEAVETVGEFGFSPEELDQVDDHRTYLVLKEVMAHRRLKAKVAGMKSKTGGKPVMLRGSTRRSSDVVRTQETKAALARLDNSGSMQDGIAAMIALDKARNR
jgi:hypothetical protein